VHLRVEHDGQGKNLAATDGMHHFDLVTGFEYRLGMLAARDNVQVQLDSNPAAGQLLAGQQVGDGLAVG